MPQTLTKLPDNPVQTAKPVQTALILAHGQPSSPQRAEAELADLTRAVAQYLPGWQVKSATLAAPDAIETACKAVEPGVVFPMFMAAGWFTAVAIPKKLEAAGARGWHILPPLGLADQVQDLAVKIAKESGADRVLLAAHGSFKSSEPARIADLVAGLISAAGIPTSAAFIDQSPQLAAAKGYGPRTVCLPWFAMMGDHVTQDLPQSLKAAGFEGQILPPLGLDPRLPRLIAEVILGG